MTTPTREQVIEWAKEAGLPDAIAAHPGVKHALALAHTAGREQGLREAKEVCVREAEFLRSDQNGGATACELCAAAIEQLRGK